MTEWNVSPCVGEPYLMGEQLYNRTYVNPVQAKLAECQNTLFQKADCIPDWEGRDVCTISEWSDWGRCSTRCGQGEKERTRAFSYPDADQYCKNVDLKEVKECYETFGCAEENDDEDENKNDPKCATTEWVLKSQCNATCELGKSVWMRKYKTEPAPADCKKKLEKIVGCNVGISNCSWYLKGTVDSTHHDSTILNIIGYF